jgi:hypothetical protein
VAQTKLRQLNYGHLLTHYKKKKMSTLMSKHTSWSHWRSACSQPPRKQYIQKRDDGERDISGSHLDPQVSVSESLTFSIMGENTIFSLSCNQTKVDEHILNSQSLCLLICRMAY